MTPIENLKLMWQRFTRPDVAVKSDLEKLHALQQTAAGRRKEYALQKEQAEKTSDASLLAGLAVSRKRMEEADLAHLAALQKWQNREARQKSY